MLDNSKMCDKAVNTYPSTIMLVSECFMTQEMCDKAINRCYFVFDSIPNRYKSQKMHHRVVSEDLFLVVYCPVKYKTQIICDKAVDDFLATLNLITDWFVTTKMIKELCTALYADENIFYFNEDFVTVVFFKMDIFDIDHNSINLDNNFDKHDPDTIFLIRILVWRIKFEKRKLLKII